ncbi:MAG: hypothetical protein VKQ33_01835 [Candidatus Sericytochromatia bacterium]|nr:hypothetical protein [Candidatus Sericytochromatia bacterium]
MPRPRAALACLALVALATGACDTPRPTATRGMTWLRPEGEASGRGRLRMQVQQALGRPAWRLLEVQQLDWDTARAWLSNARAGFAPRRLRATAVVSPSTNTRSATLAFDDLTPGEGYTLVLRLYRGGDAAAFDTETGLEAAQEAPGMIASGTLSDFPIRAGLNQVALALTLADGGRFAVTVDEPATTTAAN